MRITGFTIERFRCFEQATLDDLGRVNVIVGPNNVGKTALLLPLRHLTRLDVEFVPRKANREGTGLYGPSHWFRFLPEDHREGEAPPRLLIRLLAGGTELGQMNKTVPDSPTRRSLIIEAGEHEGEWDIRWEDVSRSSEERVNYRVRSQRAAIESLGKRITYVPSSRVSRWRQTECGSEQQEERRYDGSMLYADLLRWTLPCRASGRPDRLSTMRLQRFGRFVSDVIGCRAEVWPSPIEQEVMGVVSILITERGFPSAAAGARAELRGASDCSGGGRAS